MTSSSSLPSHLIFLFDLIFVCFFAFIRLHLSFTYRHFSFFFPTDFHHLFFSEEKLKQFLWLSTSHASLLFSFLPPRLLFFFPTYTSFYFKRFYQLSSPHHFIFQILSQHPQLSNHRTPCPVMLVSSNPSPYLSSTFLIVFTHIFLAVFAQG